MRRRIVQNDSEESSESDADSPDSDNRVNSTTNKRKPVQKRKRGRPPGAKNKKKRIQDDSEDEDSSPQPSTSQNVNNQSSAEEESESENASDSSNDISTNRKAVAPKRKRGRPPLNKNNKRQQIDSDDDASPRPSTSQVQDSGNDYVSGSGSESESADSDYGPVRDKSPAKKKPVANQKKRPPPRTSSSPKKKTNNSVNGNSRVSQSNDVSFDPILVDNLAQKLTNFLQIEDQKKYAIRRKAIVTNVFKDEPYTPKLYTAVIKKANLILKKTFGMELMELENQKDSYLIVNILRRELGIHDYVELSRIKQQQHGLITFLLTVIYMNENVITEDELTRCLKPLGIDLTSKRLHPVFGDVKKYITTELVKQMYLNYECISKEPPKYEFTWGLRAKQEFDKRDLLQFACQIMDDTAPEDWRIQFKDAEASAKPNASS